MTKQKPTSKRRFGTSGAYLTVSRGDKVLSQPRVGPRRINLSADHSSSTHPWPADKPGQNWIEKIGGKLPPFIKRVARHIMADSGYTQSRAIAAAISQCKKGKLGAKGAKAAAQWEALKARAGG